LTSLSHRGGDVERLKRGLKQAKEDRVEPNPWWETFELQALASKGDLPGALQALDALSNNGYEFSNFRIFEISKI
jgi:hypothetical protein